MRFSVSVPIIKIQGCCEEQKRAEKIQQVSAAVFFQARVFCIGVKKTCNHFIAFGVLCPLAPLQVYTISSRISPVSVITLSHISACFVIKPICAFLYRFVNSTKQEKCAVFCGYDFFQLQSRF